MYFGSFTCGAITLPPLQVGLNYPHLRRILAASTLIMRLFLPATIQRHDPVDAASRHPSKNLVLTSMSSHTTMPVCSFPQFFFSETIPPPVATHVFTYEWTC